MRPVNVFNPPPIVVPCLQPHRLPVFSPRQNLDDNHHFSLFMIRDDSVHTPLSCLQAPLCYVQSEYLPVFG